MSHSTHEGFNWPFCGVDVPPSATARPVPPSALIAPVSEIPGCAFEPSVFREPLLFESPTVGVGQDVREETASISVPPSRPFASEIIPPFDPKVLVGVGQDPPRAIVPSDGRPRLSTLFPLPFPLDPYCSRLGVG
jgi:hypothetical protein